MTDPPAYDPLGIWSGTWQSSDRSASGTLTIEFYIATGSGHGIQSVRLHASGAGCGPEGDVGEGSYAAESTSVRFFVSIRENSTATDASGASFLGQVDGNRLAGTYTTGAFGHCLSCGCPFGDDGSWSATATR